MEDNWIDSVYSDIANAFNNFSVDVGENLAKWIRKPVQPPTQKRVMNSFYLKPVTRDEIVNTINDLKLDNSPGIFQIRTETESKWTYCWSTC